MCETVTCFNIAASVVHKGFYARPKTRSQPAVVRSLAVELNTMEPRGCSNCVAHCKFKASKQMRIVWCQEHANNIPL